MSGHAATLVARLRQVDEVAPSLDGIEGRDWLRAGLIIVVALAVSRLVHLVVRRAFTWEGGEVAGRLLARVIGIVAVVAGVVYALNTLDVRIGPLLGALGIGGLALAFAAQSILENFFSSILIQARRPFRIGSQVIVGSDVAGTVEDINFRVVVVRTYDGEQVLVPASEVLQHNITNISVHGSWRTSLDVGVEYGSDLAGVQRLLTHAVGMVDGVRPSPPPEVWFKSFGASSLDLVVRFWHDPDMATRWRVRSAVGLAVTTALKEADIDIPFPQMVIRSSGRGATDAAEQ